jgi:transposase
VQVGGLYGRKIVLFHFDPSRSGDIPIALLDGYQGFVTTDDYSGYNRIEGVAGIRRLQCWMHVRRYFKKALKALGKHGKGGRADQALGKIRELYMIERKCHDFTPEDRHRYRLEFAKPLLDDFRPWLEMAFGDVPPKSATGKALKHALDVWPYLIVYLEDGRLLMDNSPAENAIRPVAVGRKNWLFSHSVEGAEATAILYSVIETAKAHGFDPFLYLMLVIERLPTAHTLADVEALLPWNITRPQIAATSDLQQTSP